jgi:diguanylate cyclase (GGDEF)-like protein
MADIDYVQEPAELRSHVARSLLQRAQTIVLDSVGVYPFAGMENVDADDRSRLADLILQLLTDAVREGILDSRSVGVADLRQLASEKSVDVRLLFKLVYLMERSALDELALDESFGATSEPWPTIAQMMRRASFDVLTAYTELLSRDPGEAGVVDALTTLHTKAVLAAALEKEIQRSERFGHPFALILLDVDRLADINAKHGYGAGDRVLERIGIVVRAYFREQDWVARSSGDTFAVLLPETPRAHAEHLADLVRATVEERLELHDYRSQERVPVTVSVGLVIAESVDQSVRAEHLLSMAREAVDRAKQAGRNRVQRAVATVGRSAPPARDSLPMD